MDDTTGVQFGSHTSSTLEENERIGNFERNLHDSNSETLKNYKQCSFPLASLLCLLQNVQRRFYYENLRKDFFNSLKIVEMSRNDKRHHQGF